MVFTTIPTAFSHTKKTIFRRLFSCRTIKHQRRYSFDGRAKKHMSQHGGQKWLHLIYKQCTTENSSSLVDRRVLFIYYQWFLEFPKNCLQMLPDHHKRCWKIYTYYLTQCNTTCHSSRSTDKRPFHTP